MYLINYCYLPGQRCILHLLEKYPNHLGHPDPTYKIIFFVKSKIWKQNLWKLLKWKKTCHKRSHIGPSWGTSCNRSSALIWSNVSMLGLSPVNKFLCEIEKLKKKFVKLKILNTLPPWRQKICPSTSAVNGK